MKIGYSVLNIEYSFLFPLKQGLNQHHLIITTKTKDLYSLNLIMTKEYLMEKGGNMKQLQFHTSLATLGLTGLKSYYVSIR